jgi:hypothetical protein
MSLLPSLSAAHCLLSYPTDKAWDVAFRRKTESISVPPHPKCSAVSLAASLYAIEIIQQKLNSGPLVIKYSDYQRYIAEVISLIYSLYLMPIACSHRCLVGKPVGRLENVGTEHLPQNGPRTLGPGDDVYGINWASIDFSL